MITSRVPYLDQVSAKESHDLIECSDYSSKCKRIPVYEWYDLSSFNTYIIQLCADPGSSFQELLISYLFAIGLTFR